MWPFRHPHPSPLRAPVLGEQRRAVQVMLGADRPTLSPAGEGCLRSRQSPRPYSPHIVVSRSAGPDSLRLQERACGLHHKLRPRYGWPPSTSDDQLGAEAQEIDEIGAIRNLVSKLRFRKPLGVHATGVFQLGCVAAQVPCAVGRCLRGGCDNCASPSPFRRCAAPSLSRWERNWVARSIPSPSGRGRGPSRKRWRVRAIREKHLMARQHSS